MGREQPVAVEGTDAESAVPAHSCYEGGLVMLSVIGIELVPSGS